MTAGGIDIEKETAGYGLAADGSHAGKYRRWGKGRPMEMAAGKSGQGRVLANSIRVLGIMGN